MKNRQVQNLMKKLADSGNAVRRKAFSLFLGIAAAASLTACSFDFEGTDELIQGLMDITLDYACEELTDRLTQADPSTEEGLSEIQDAVLDFTGEVERIGGVEFMESTLVRVVDGDTLVVNISGEDKKVRLIGINTPESVAPENYRNENTTEGIAASDYVKHMLSDVKTVYLQKDKSETDRYGRLLRYVWLEKPKDAHSMEEVAEKMLNGILVLEKIAEPVEYAPDTAYAEMFDELYLMD